MVPFSLASTDKNKMTATPQAVITASIAPGANGILGHLPSVPTRATISAVLIVKNEAHVLEPCLASLIDWVDEIVILDSGSTDGTVQLATQYGAKVHVREDWQGFGLQRQRAQSFATGDYILAIDADERISSELRQSIEVLLANSDEDRLYQVVRHNSFLDKTPFHNGWRREKIIRIYSRKKFAFNSRPVHESVDRGESSIHTLRGALIHDACRDYEYYLEKHLAYAHAWARGQAAKGKIASFAAPLLHGLMTFVRLFFLQGGFLDGRHGFLFAAHLSQYSFNKYAALWHYSRQRKNKGDCA